MLRTKFAIRSARPELQAAVLVAKWLCLCPLHLLWGCKCILFRALRVMAPSSAPAPSKSFGGQLNFLNLAHTAPLSGVFLGLIVQLQFCRTILLARCSRDRTASTGGCLPCKNLPFYCQFGNKSQRGAHQNFYQKCAGLAWIPFLGS